jgi:hypothetical protein
MPEIGGQAQCVHALIDQLKAGAVAQQMGVNIAQTGSLGGLRILQDCDGEGPDCVSVGRDDMIGRAADQTGAPCRS